MQDKIIDKIKKLLRMKRGGTPEEIATALRLAQELATKYKIDLASVNPDDEASNKITHEDIILGSRIQWECKYAALICKNFFHVEILIHRLAQLRIAFIGTQKDIEIARYVYAFIVRRMRASWLTKRGRARNRQAFLYGMFLGICSNLRENQENHQSDDGLILLKRGLAQRSSYLEKYFGKTKARSCEPDSKSDNALMKGFFAGKEVIIRDGLQAPNQMKYLPA